MRLAFMGTARFAVPSLRALVASGHRLEAAFTQPDRPSGRGRRLRASPVKEAAESLGLPVYQPESLRTDTVRDQLRDLCPELVVVVAYGQIIPKWLIDIPRAGIVNLHGSLLPKYRGAAPVNWAIARGETRTGVCTMQIDEGLDTGPLYLCEEVEIQPEETAPDLSERLASLGASLVVRTVAGLEEGSLAALPQDHSRATLAPRLHKEDGYIRWEESADQIHDKVRGFLPWPAVTVRFRERPCRILESRRLDPSGGLDPPGKIQWDNRCLSVACGERSRLEIRRLQIENRNAVSGIEFAHGVRLRPEEAFGVMD